MRVMSVRELIIELLSGSMEGAVVEVAPTVYSIPGNGGQPAPAEAVAVQPTGQAKVVPAEDLGPISAPEPQFEMYVEGKPAPPRVNKAVREFPGEDS